MEKCDNRDILRIQWAGHTDSMMANIVNFIENDGRVELVDYSTEIYMWINYKG